MTEPETRPSQAEEAAPPKPPGPPPTALTVAAHELDFRFKLESVKLRIMQPKTIITSETRLQKYHDVIRVVVASSPRGCNTEGLEIIRELV